MNSNRRTFKISLIVTLIVSLIVASSRSQAETSTCGGVSITVPFTDVSGSNIFFCAIAEAYFSGLTNGTTPTTYSPSDNVTREQMAAFITRTQDSALRRGSKRAALRQFWNTRPRYESSLGALGTTYLQGAINIQLVESDGTDLCLAGYGSGTVSRVRASDGKLLDTWNLATNALGVSVAMGRVLVTGTNGNLYFIDPRQGGGNNVAIVANTPGNGAEGIAYDGNKIWTANINGSVSTITPNSGNPWDVLNLPLAWVSPKGVIFDGDHIWVTDQGSGILWELTPTKRCCQDG